MIVSDYGYSILPQGVSLALDSCLDLQSVRQVLFNLLPDNDLSTDFTYCLSVERTQVCVYLSCSEDPTWLLLLLCADEATNVNPDPLQDEQERQQVEEQRNCLEGGAGQVWGW